MANYFLKLRLSLSGARHFKRPDCFQPRVEDFHAAITRAAIQIEAAMRTQTAAILLAQWTSRQREQHLLANQRAQVYLVALVQRKFQILRAKRVVVVSNRFGRQHKTERTIARRVKILGTSRAHCTGPGLQLAGEKQLGPCPIERNRNFNWSFEVILADWSRAQHPVDFILRLGKRQLFSVGRYVLDSDFHVSHVALWTGQVERELLHFAHNLQIPLARSQFSCSVGRISP